MSQSMCTVSMMSEVAGWIPDSEWTPIRLKRYAELAAELQKVDTKLGLPDCGSEAKEKLIQDLAKKLGVKIYIPDYRDPLDIGVDSDSLGVV